MSETPIDDEFNGFMRAVFPAVHPDSQQYRVMRDAFFAGAIAHHSTMQKATVGWNEDEDPIPPGVKALTAEMRGFGQELALRAVKPMGRG